MDDFNKQYSKILVNNDFEVGTWVLVHETWLDTQQENKGMSSWSGPCIIHECVVHDGKLRGYKLHELNGTIHRGTIALDHVKIFYYKEEHQTIKTYSATSYASLIQVHKDPAPHLHFNAYQCCVSLILAQPSSPIIDTPIFHSEIPILNVGSAVGHLGITTTCHVREGWEKILTNLSWEYHTNEYLEFNPVVSTNVQHSKHDHPMVGDLNNLFKNGTYEVFITSFDECGGPLPASHHHVKHNIDDLTWWTDEMVELQQGFY